MNQMNYNISHSIQQPPATTLFNLVNSVKITKQFKELPFHGVKSEPVYLWTNKLATILIYSQHSFSTKTFIHFI